MHDRTTISAFTEWFGVPAKPASVLLILFTTGKALRSTHLAEKAGLSPGALRLYIHELRTSMDAESIDYDVQAGYSLTEGGMLQCRSALAQIAKARAEDSVAATEIALASARAVLAAATAGAQAVARSGKEWSGTMGLAA